MTDAIYSFDFKGVLPDFELECCDASEIDTLVVVYTRGDVQDLSPANGRRCTGARIDDVSENYL